MAYKDSLIAKSVKAVTPPVLPVFKGHVTLAELNQRNHPINDPTRSGKRMGSFIMMIGQDNPMFAIATGSMPTDSWCVTQTHALKYQPV